MESKANVWTPSKDLLRLAEAVIIEKNHDLFPDFETALKKQQAGFCALLKNPGKDASHRELLKKGVKEPVQLPGWQTSQTLPQSLVDEACILSDMYELNELSALSLLALGEEQGSVYPGLKRGLIAVLLYYDAKYSQATALKMVVQAGRGIQWTYQLTEDVLDFVNRYSDRLFELGVFERLLAILSDFSLAKEMELLSTNQALGPPRHRRQLMDYIKKTRHAVADTIFSRSAQRGLPLAQTLRLIDYLADVEPEKPGEEPIDFSHVVLLLSLLYSFDLSVLHRHEDGEELAKELPVLVEKNFVVEVSKALGQTGKPWKNPGFRGLARLAWATSLAALRSMPQERNEDRARLEQLEQDEAFVDLALEDKAFNAVSELLTKYSSLYSEEFYVKRLHYLITDLLVLMPLKMKELRNKAEETARTLIVYQQEGLTPPANLPQHFEHLLEAIASLYLEDPLQLNLNLEFWYSSADYHGPQRNNARQMALNKFVRLAGDLLPPSLYIPYTRMLGSLANSPRAAHYAFNLLKQNGVGQSSTVSWDHFFASLARYLSNLKQENYPVQDTVYRQRVGVQGGITAQEMAGFQEILRLTRIVAGHDDVARMALAENPAWTPLVTLLGLVTCSVPLPLKADFLTTLAAFAKSRDIASALWNHIEMAQVITTVTTASTFPQRGVHTDLEEVESRNEEYPLTRGFLELLNALVKVEVPLHLGAPNRTPGIDPYVKFVVENVLLRSPSRAYRKSSEKWQVCRLAVKFLYRLLSSYEPTLGDIQPRARDAVQHPGCSILISLLQDSPLLRMMLFLTDESVRHFDEYKDFPGRDACEQTALHCLKTFSRCIKLQEVFLEMVRSEGSSLRVISLGTLLLGVNQRTNRPDHMLNIAKFVSYGSEYMPNHAVEASQILAFVAVLPSAQQQLLALFSAEPNDITARHGIVELLDDNFEDQEEGRKAKVCILRMLQQGINLPHPSFAHFLLGFSTQKPLQKSQMQSPGVYGTPRNCLHSVVNMLDEGLKGSLDPLVILDGYKLLYGILSHSAMSYPALRYLKGNLRNFLARHGEAVPFTPTPSVEQLSSMAYLLLSIAIDIRVSSIRGSTSQAQKLANILFSTEGGQETGETEALGRETTGVSLLSRTFASTTGAPTALRPRVLALLDCIDVSEVNVPVPELELFDLGQLQALLKECEMPSADGGPSVINVRHLQRRVEAELSVLEGTAALAQRQAIMQEFKTILQYSIESNNVKQQVWARRCFIDAWRQTLETILLSITNYSNNILVQVVQEVLRKSVQDSASQELNQPLSGLLVIAITSLRVQLMKKQENPVNDTFVSFLDRSGRNEALSGIGIPPSAVRVITKGIVEWILKTGPSAQRIRINLYTALVGCLRLSAANIYRDNRGLGGSIGATSQITGVDTVLEYGDSFLSALCRDSASGHDVQRMLALSLLDTVVAQSPVGPVASFAAKHGYIRHLLEILGSLDESLTMAIERHPSAVAMRSLQLYASIMSFVTRLAMTSRGSQLLLDTNMLRRLSEMSVFSLRPESSSQDEYTFLTSPFHRFQEILFPAFSLCQAMLAALGPEHRAVREQVVGFLLAHSETVSNILRNGPAVGDLHHLEELTLLTSIISKSTTITIFSEMHPNAPEGNAEIRSQVLRLQNICLGLLPAYTPTDASLDRLVRSPGVEEDPSPHTARHRAIKMYLQVCLNLLSIALNMTSDSSKAYSRLVFTPSFTSGDFNTSFSGVRGQTARSVALGVVVNILSATASRARNTEIARDTLARKLEAVESLPVEDIVQFIPRALDDSISVTEKRDLAKQTLASVVESQVRELVQCKLILEIGLVLLWKHLEGFAGLNGSSNISGVNLGFETSVKFKDDAVQFLDETFFKQIEEASKITAIGGASQDFSIILARKIKKSCRN